MYEEVGLLILLNVREYIGALKAWSYFLVMNTSAQCQYSCWEDKGIFFQLYVSKPTYDNLQMFDGTAVKIDKEAHMVFIF